MNIEYEDKNKARQALKKCHEGERSKKLVPFLVCKRPQTIIMVKPGLTAEQLEEKKLKYTPK